MQRMALHWPNGNWSASVDNTIQYLNTDLDLVSTQDIRSLVSAFDVGGARAMQLAQGDDGQWYATIEMSNESEPELNIADLLALVELLPGSLRSMWDGCRIRRFDIGYDCGEKPWAFTQSLSAALLARIAAVGASLKITLYPDRPEESVAVSCPS